MMASRHLTTATDFVAVYAEMGCVPGIFDIHHGANGVIEFDGPDRARGALVAAVPQHQPGQPHLDPDGR
jgi:hypothetical protein